MLSPPPKLGPLNLFFFFFFFKFFFFFGWGGGGRGGGGRGGGGEGGGVEGEGRGGEEGRRGGSLEKEEGPSFFRSFSTNLPPLIPPPPFGVLSNFLVYEIQKLYFLFFSFFPTFFPFFSPPFFPFFFSFFPFPPPFFFVRGLSGGGEEMKGEKKGEGSKRRREKEGKVIYGGWKRGKGELYLVDIRSIHISGGYLENRV